MNSIFQRERNFRGETVLDQLSQAHITIAGIGTLGSNLADTLSRQGAHNLRLIDQDRVEAHNIGTQIYSLADVGALKVDALRNAIYRNIEVEVEVVNRELKTNNIKKCLKGTDLVIDAFDNSQSRRLLRDYCRNQGIPCLHVGLIDGYGEIAWNGVYRIPQDAEDDACNLAMARNLAMIVISIAAEEIVDFLTAEIARMESRCITLKDLCINQY